MSVYGPINGPKDELINELEVSVDLQSHMPNMLVLRQLFWAGLSIQHATTDTIFIHFDVLSTLSALVMSNAFSHSLVISLPETLDWSTPISFQGRGI